ncbi:MAG: GIY-YIG nuclease family protein, partial [Clostridia bacterium]|nr:GIY-YIG nuclease family protein [Clostridia bacterium]
MEKKFYVYILTSRNCKALYVGVTDNLSRRLEEHKSRTVEGFTSKYRVSKLV